MPVDTDLPTGTGWTADQAAEKFRRSLRAITLLPEPLAQIALADLVERIDGNGRTFRNLTIAAIAAGDAGS